MSRATGTLAGTPAVNLARPAEPVEPSSYRLFWEETIRQSRSVAPGRRDAMRGFLLGRSSLAEAPPVRYLPVDLAQDERGLPPWGAFSPGIPGPDGIETSFGGLIAAMAQRENLVGSALFTAMTRGEAALGDPQLFRRRTMTIHPPAGKPVTVDFDRDVWMLSHQDILPAEAIEAWERGYLDWADSEHRLVWAIASIQERDRARRKVESAGLGEGLAAGLVGAGFLDPTNVLAGSALGRGIARAGWTTTERIGARQALRVGWTGRLAFLGGNFATTAAQEFGTVALSEGTKTREEAFAGLALATAIDFVVQGGAAYLSAGRYTKSSDATPKVADATNRGAAEPPRARPRPAQTFDDLENDPEFMASIQEPAGSAARPRTRPDAAAVLHDARELLDAVPDPERAADAEPRGSADPYGAWTPEGRRAGGARAGYLRILGAMLRPFSSRAALETSDNGPVQALHATLFSTMLERRAAAIPVEQTIIRLRDEAGEIYRTLDAEYAQLAAVRKGLAAADEAPGAAARATVDLAANLQGGEAPRFGTDRGSWEQAVALVDLYDDPAGGWIEPPHHVGEYLDEVADRFGVTRDDLRQRAQRVLDAAGPRRSTPGRAGLDVDRSARRHSVAVLTFRDNASLAEIEAAMRIVLGLDAGAGPADSLAPFLARRVTTLEEIAANPDLAAERIRRHWNTNLFGNFTKEQARTLMLLSRQYGHVEADEFGFASVFRLDYRAAVQRSTRALIQWEGLEALRRFEGRLVDPRSPTHDPLYPPIDVPEGSVTPFWEGGFEWGRELGEDVRAEIQQRLEAFIDRANNYAGERLPQGPIARRDAIDARHRADLETLTRKVDRLLHLVEPAETGATRSYTRSLVNLTRATYLVKSGLSQLPDTAIAAVNAVAAGHGRAFFRSFRPGVQRLKRAIRGGGEEAPTLRKLSHAFDGMNRRVAEFFGMERLERIGSDARRGLAGGVERVSETMANVTGVLSGMQPLTDLNKHAATVFRLEQHAEILDAMPRILAAVDAGESIDQAMRGAGLESRESRRVAKRLYAHEQERPGFIARLAGAYARGETVEWNGVRLPRVTRSLTGEAVLHDVPTTRAAVRRFLEEQLSYLRDAGETEANVAYEIHETEFSTTFAGPITTEAREALAGRPHLRRLVAQNKPRGGAPAAEDFIAARGTDEWVRRLELLHGGESFNRILDEARGHPDPEINFAAWLLDAIDRAEFETIEVRQGPRAGRTFERRRVNLAQVLAGRIRDGVEISIVGQGFTVRHLDGNAIIRLESVEKVDPLAGVVARLPGEEGHLRPAVAFDLPPWAVIPIDREVRDALNLIPVDPVTRLPVARGPDGRPIEEPAAEAPPGAAAPLGTAVEAKAPEPARARETRPANATAVEWFKRTFPDSAAAREQGVPPVNTDWLESRAERTIAFMDRAERTGAQRLVVPYHDSRQPGAKRAILIERGAGGLGWVGRDVDERGLADLAGTTPRTYDSLRDAMHNELLPEIGSLLPPSGPHGERDLFVGLASVQDGAGKWNGPYGRRQDLNLRTIDRTARREAVIGEMRTVLAGTRMTAEEIDLAEQLLRTVTDDNPDVIDAIRFTGEAGAPAGPALNDQTDLGPTLTEFRHDAAGAIARLRELQSGDAIAALHHPDVGDIDLIWGGRGFGLEKIVARHPEVLDDLQGIIGSMSVRERNDNSVTLESPNHEAVVRLNWFGREKRWLLTAYEKQRPLDAGRTIDVAGSPEGAAGRQAPPRIDGPETSVPPEGGSVKPGLDAPERLASIGVQEIDGMLRAVVNFTRRADMFSFIHEIEHLGHFLANDADWAALRSAVAPQGWTREAAEKLADLVLAAGGAAARALPDGARVLLQRVQSMIAAVWKALIGQGVSQIDPRIGDFARRWFAGEVVREQVTIDVDELGNPTTRGRRIGAGEVQRRLGRARSMLDEIAAAETDRLRAEYEADVDALMGMIDQDVNTMDVLSPRALDRPVFADSAIGSALFTFWSFPSLIGHRLLLGAVDRSAGHNAALVAGMMGAGLVGLLLKDWVNRGDDPAQSLDRYAANPLEFGAAWLRNAGVLGLYEAPVSLASQAAQGEGFTRGRGGLVGSLLPVAGLMNDYADVAADLFESAVAGDEFTEGERRQLYRALWVGELLPARLVARVLDEIDPDESEPAAGRRALIEFLHAGRR